MWKQPHFIYRFQTEVDPTVLEQLVPGVLVYGYLDGARHRVLKHEEPQRFREYELYVPLHGAWLVEGALIDAGIQYTADPRYVSNIEPWDDARRPDYEAEGRAIIRRLSLAGKLKPHVHGMVTPYQAMGVRWAETRPYVFNVWACGLAPPSCSVLQKPGMCGGVKSKSIRLLYHTVCARVAKERRGTRLSKNISSAWATMPL